MLRSRSDRVGRAYGLRLAKGKYTPMGLIIHARMLQISLVPTQIPSVFNFEGYCLELRR